MLARTLKTTGRAKRPMIVVPKSVLANWFAECEKWFPGSSVLTIGGSFERLPDGSLKGKDDNATRTRLKTLKWALTVFFLVLGLATLAAYIKLGIEHAPNAGQPYPTPAWALPGAK